MRLHAESVRFKGTPPWVTKAWASVSSASALSTAIDFLAKIFDTFPSPSRSQAGGGHFRLDLSALMLVGDELLGSIGRELGGDQILRRCDRCVDRVAPQLAHRFHLSAGDLLLGDLYAAVEIFLQRLACLPQLASPLAWRRAR